jgi:hypothetical protein
LIGFLDSERINLNCMERRRSARLLWHNLISNISITWLTPNRVFYDNDIVEVGGAPRRPAAPGYGQGPAGAGRGSPAPPGARPWSSAAGRRGAGARPVLFQLILMRIQITTLDNLR